MSEPPEYGAAPTPGHLPPEPDRDASSEASAPSRAPQPSRYPDRDEDPALDLPTPTSRTTRVIVAAAVVLVAAGLGAGAFAMATRPDEAASTDSAPSPTQPGSTPTASAPTGAVSSPTPSLTAAPSPTPAPIVAVLDDGSWSGPGVVGDAYRAYSASAAGDACRWTLAGPDGAVVEVGTGVGGIPTVTLFADEVLSTQGCGEWTRVSPAALFDEVTMRPQLTEGVWLVGADVHPGTYLSLPADPAGPGCGVVVTRGWRWSPDAEVDATEVRGGVVALTVDRGMQVVLSGDCGTWQVEEVS